MKVTLGRIVIVVQDTREYPAIVTRAGANALGLMLFDPDSVTPQQADNVPFFGAEYLAREWQMRQTASGGRACYLPGKYLPDMSQVSTTLQEIDADLNELLGDAANGNG